MPEAGAIRAGRAYVELFAKDGRLVKGLQRASARLKAFGTFVSGIGLKVAAAGAALTAPLLASVKGFASMGDKLDKMSKRTGVSVEALSELAYAAGQSGVELEDLEKSVSRMQRSIRDAGAGLQTQTLALKHLGLTYAVLKDLSPEQQFLTIAEAVSRVADPTQQAAISMELFGRSGRQLMPMLVGGAKGIDLLRQKARKLGLTMSTEDASAAARLTDDMHSLWNVVKRGAFVVGSALAPVLDELVNRLTGVLVQTNAWIRQNSGLVISFAQLAAGTLAAGIALKVLGGVIAGLGTVLGVVAVAFKVLAVAVGLVLTPIGAVMVALGALGGYLLYSTGASGKALDWLGGKFDVLRQDAQTAYQGIADALAAGDIGLAAKVLWTALKLEWVRGGNALGGAWQDSLLWMKDALARAWGGVQGIFSTVAHGLKIAWIETTAFLGKTWAGFVNGVLTAWNWAGKQLTKAWNWIKGLFDESFDVEAANKAADQAYAATKARLGQESADRKRAVEEQRAAERKQEAETYSQVLQQIVSETEARRQASKKEHDLKVAQAQDALRQAQSDLAAAAKEAKTKRIAKEGEGPGKLEGPGSLDEIMKRIGTVATDFTKMTDKITVTGTFSAAAAFGLAAQSTAAERTAKATETTATNTKKLLDEQKRGGARFT